MARSPVQPRQALFQHHKRAPRQFRGGCKIHVAERGAEIVMRLWRERIVADRAEYVVLHIAVFVDAVRHFVERQVRIRGELLCQFLIRLLRRQLELRHRGLSSATSAISFAART